MPLYDFVALVLSIALPLSRSLSLGLLVFMFSRASWPRILAECQKLDKLKLEAVERSCFFVLFGARLQFRGVFVLACIRCFPPYLASHRPVSH